MISPVPPEITRTTTRRKNLKKKWGGKEWKVKRLAFIDSRGGKCEWCESKERLTVHHPQRNSYGTSAYMDFFLSGCILLCSRCHAALHAGRVICEREHDDKEVHYRWHDAEMCSYCFLKLHPELKEQKKRDRNKQRRKKVQARKALLHPCKFRGIEQKCKRKPGEICTYTAKKAPQECRKFKAKAKEVKAKEVNGNAV